MNEDNAEDRNGRKQLSLSDRVRVAFYRLATSGTIDALSNGASSMSAIADMVVKFPAAPVTSSLGIASQVASLVARYGEVDPLDFLLENQYHLTQIPSRECSTMFPQTADVESFIRFMRCEVLIRHGPSCVYRATDRMYAAVTTEPNGRQTTCRWYRDETSSDDAWTNRKKAWDDVLAEYAKFSVQGMPSEGVHLLVMDPNTKLVTTKPFQYRDVMDEDAVMHLVQETNILRRVGETAGFLLHGPAGTGKTSVAIGVGMTLGRLVLVVEADICWDPMVHNIISLVKPAAVLFDDIDKDERPVRSSAYTGFLSLKQELREHTVFFCTTNSLKVLGDAFTRPERGGWSYFLGPPTPEKVRSILLSQQMTEHQVEYLTSKLPLDLGITHDWINKLGAQVRGYREVFKNQSFEDIADRLAFATETNFRASMSLPALSRDLTSQRVVQTDKKNRSSKAAAWRPAEPDPSKGFKVWRPNKPDSQDLDALWPTKPIVADDDRLDDDDDEDDAQPDDDDGYYDDDS